MVETFVKGKLILESSDHIDLLSTDVPSTEVSAVSSDADAELSSSDVDTASYDPDAAPSEPEYYEYENINGGHDGMSPWDADWEADWLSDVNGHV